MSNAILKKKLETIYEDENENKKLLNWWWNSFLQKRNSKKSMDKEVSSSRNKQMKYSVINYIRTP